MNKMKVGNTKAVVYLCLSSAWTVYLSIYLWSCLYTLLFDSGTGWVSFVLMFIVFSGTVVGFPVILARMQLENSIFTLAISAVLSSLILSIAFGLFIDMFSEEYSSDYLFEFLFGVLFPCMLAYIVYAILLFQSWRYTDISKRSYGRLIRSNFICCLLGLFLSIVVMLAAKSVFETIGNNVGNVIGEALRGKK